MLTSICYLLSDGNSHNNRCEVLWDCGFDLHVSGDEWCWAPFNALAGRLYMDFGNMPFQVLYSPIFLKLGCLLYYSAKWAFFKFWIWTSYHMFYNFFHPCKMSFPLVNVSFPKQKIFSLMCSHSLIFVFIDCAFGVISETSFPRPRSRRFLPM